MEEKQKYNVNQLLAFVDDIAEILGGGDVIDYIAVTPNEFSIYINNGISMILVQEINRFNKVFEPDTVFFNENHPQLIIANTNIQESKTPNENIQYFIKFVNDVAEFICPCTGSEIHIKNREIKVFIDQVNLSHDEYIGVYNLLDENDLLFQISLGKQRPCIKIMSREDVFNEQSL